MSVAVEFIDLRKAFGPVQVLHGVSFALQPGRVIGVLGENGAGKSTLMKILAGYEQASGGEMRINGQARSFAGSRAAEAEGIVLIHQEFNLAEDLTIVRTSSSATSASAAGCSTTMQCAPSPHACCNRSGCALTPTRWSST